MFKNRVTTGLIESYLEKHGWKGQMSLPQPGEKEGVVLTGWGGQHVLVIDPIKEKNAVHFVVPNILKAPPSSTPTERLNGLLMGMGLLNLRMLLGSWGYDPSGGEVTFNLGVPTDDDDLSFEEFEHCLNALTITVDLNAPKLKAIAEGTKTVEQFLAEEGSKMG